MLPLKLRVLRFPVRGQNRDFLEELSRICFNDCLLTVIHFIILYNFLDLTIALVNVDLWDLV